LDSVKGKKLIPFIATILLINFAVPLISRAESLDSLDKKEEAANQNSVEISEEINTALNDVNQKYAEIEKLKTDISKAEETLKTTQDEIEVTETNIERRKAVVAERMRNVQLNGGDQRNFQALLEAESITDFFNRAYALTILQGYEQEKVESLTAEKEKLATLQDKVVATQKSLEENESKLQAEAETMDAQVVELKEKLVANQELLAQISDEKMKEQVRIENEKAAKKAEEEAAKKAKAEAEAEAKKQAESSSSAETSSSSEETTAPSTTTPSDNTSADTPSNSTGETANTGGNGSGQVLYVQSTAYSWREQGASPYSALGIDLRKESNVIAVDPSVIKLGSLVKVEGYGFAIAGDTGGAIKGNIVDVHFDTVEQCRIWGRKFNVRVDIQ
jgi:peptidoglycan hydrolase CwlO-like protein/3D (Asp-Asp-Asp) domain-containing protein